MFLTHFGPSRNVRPHLQSLMENLRRGTDEERARALRGLRESRAEATPDGRTHRAAQRWRAVRSIVAGAGALLAHEGRVGRV